MKKKEEKLTVLNEAVVPPDLLLALKGTLTPMVWNIITSGIVFGYVFSHSAVAFSFPLTIAMYFFAGWYQDQ